ncbi:hypothetical protein [Dictyobacter formicarum]|uniref:hypothetical protein n=1 Tax=Dictyobacter formicarum TaxID=2778368 RepID=UPI001915170E|nr:hypothetical protein [Dictyobacter formicarum]
MRKSDIKRVFTTLSCILILGSMLFLAACGGSSTPSSPGGSPHQKPGGYYLIGAFSHDIQAWWQH